VNSAIHEQCSELLLIALYSTVQLACTVNTKQQNAASSFLRHRRKKHVGSIHSKLCMDCYQMAADCVLIKTQLQPRKQTNPKRYLSRIKFHNQFLRIYLSRIKFHFLKDIYHKYNSEPPHCAETMEFQFLKTKKKPCDK